jgi:hypothetical protein
MAVAARKPQLWWRQPLMGLTAKASPEDGDPTTVVGAPARLRRAVATSTRFVEGRLSSSRLLTSGIVKIPFDVWRRRGMSGP